MAKALTFYDDRHDFEVEIVKRIGDHTFKVKLEEGKFVLRHRDRLVALDDEARELLKR